MIETDLLQSYYFTSDSFYKIPYFQKIHSKSARLIFSAR